MLLDDIRSITGRIGNTLKELVYSYQPYLYDNCRKKRILWKCGANKTKVYENIDH